jgi:hypothetical protein
LKFLPHVSKIVAAEKPQTKDCIGSLLPFPTRLIYTYIVIIMRFSYNFGGFKRELIVAGGSN